MNYAAAEISMKHYGSAVGALQRALDQITTKQGMYVYYVLTFKVTQVLKVSMFNSSHSKYKWTLNFTTISAYVVCLFIV